MHEVICNECGHVIIRAVRENQWGPMRTGMVDVELLLKQLNGECPNCHVKLTLKDYEVEIIRI